MPRPAKFTDKQRAAMLAMYHELDKNGRRVYFKADICKKFKVKMATLDYYIDAANKKNGRNGHKKAAKAKAPIKATFSIPSIFDTPALASAPMPEKAPELPMNVAHIVRVGQREYEITHVVKDRETGRVLPMEHANFLVSNFYAK